jgi:hypothetical protein
MEYIEVILYDVPEFETLKEELKNQVIVAQQGKFISIGESTAEKVGFLTEWFNNSSGWLIKSGTHEKVLTVPGRDLEKARIVVIDRLAALEAKRTLPEDVKNASLKNSLLERVAQLG